MSFCLKKYLKLFIMPNEVPKIEPIKIIDYQIKQSKYNMVPKLPCRSILLGPSGSGKTVLLQNLILDVYRGAFERIYIFSPSIDVDSSWVPVKAYIEKDMKVKNTKDDPIYFNHYNPDDLNNIIDTQHKVIEYLKKQKEKRLFSILVVVDDFADCVTFSRHSKLLHSLYTRGRHNSISTITATQKFAAIANIIRVNATELYVFRLRNFRDLETFIEEVSAAIDKKTLMELYKIATTASYSFLYVNLRAKTIKDMFYINFSNKLVVDD